MRGGNSKSAGDGDIARQLEEMGAPPDVVAKARQRNVPTAITVWPENKLPLDVFCAMATQWRFVPMGMAGALLQGLDYNVLPFVMRMMRVPAKERASLFADLQIMERAALAVMNEE